MLDKNGIEIKTGQIVEISGAYFKNDNGLYFVDKAPGDPSWCGRDYSLVKISKKGKISTAKRNLCFWPIGVFVNDPWKRAAANDWNKKNATIEVKDGINRSEVKAHFAEEADSLEDQIQRMSWDWGKDHPEVIRNKEIQNYYRTVAASIA